MNNRFAFSGLQLSRDVQGLIVNPPETDKKPSRDYPGIHENPYISDLSFSSQQVEKPKRLVFRPSIDLSDGYINLPFNGDIGLDEKTSLSSDKLSQESNVDLIKKESKQSEAGSYFNTHKYFALRLTESEKLAIKLGYEMVEDEKAYRGRYFIKNGLKWIHNIGALRVQLSKMYSQCVTDVDLFEDFHYDVEAYYCYNID
ncbi:hypothetical protein [Basilea psittacipulmonis]|uniref:Uncharacterized protein n=1 Tax=Basilea psittacipulmonis DSM 24701 TaxID=1072685 RepID=A0A077DIB5_9BURK|nr:hypothetical protein [Basilea psittacipulmonis]AIL32908.1 hypothetical protein IX83_05880 [Basilea psittacipulmonis DSM 24701]